MAMYSCHYNFSFLEQFEEDESIEEKKNKTKRDETKRNENCKNKQNETTSIISRNDESGKNYE